MDKNINDSKSFFWKYYFTHTTFLYSSTRSSGHYQSFFLISDFLAESRKARQKLIKKITHFAMQFRSKNLTHFTNLNSHDIENIMLSQHSQKPYFTSFLANIFLFGVRKNIYTAPFLNAQELHSWSTLKASICIFLYVSLRKLFSQRGSKICTSRVRLWLNFS